MLLAVRKKAKKRKPFFVVKEYHDTARIKKRWRRPRGIHSAKGNIIMANLPALIRGIVPLLPFVAFIL